MINGQITLRTRDIETGEHTGYTTVESKSEDGISWTYGEGHLPNAATAANEDVIVKVLRDPEPIVYNQKTYTQNEDGTQTLTLTL